MRILYAMFIMLTLVTGAFAANNVEEQFQQSIGPITFCSIYGRLVIDKTELITDEQTKQQFYTLEKNASLAMTKFVEVNKVSPKIEYQKIFLNSVEGAMEIFKAEEEVGKKNLLMSERFKTCQKTLFDAFDSFGVKEFFKDNYSLKKPMFNMSAPLHRERQPYSLEA